MTWPLFSTAMGIVVASPAFGRPEPQIGLLRALLCRASCPHRKVGIGIGIRVQASSRVSDEPCLVAERALSEHCLVFLTRPRSSIRSIPAGSFVTCTTMRGGPTNEAADSGGGRLP